MLVHKGESPRGLQVLQEDSKGNASGVRRKQIFIRKPLLLLQRAQEPELEAQLHSGMPETVRPARWR